MHPWFRGPGRLEISQESSLFGVRDGETTPSLPQPLAERKVRQGLAVQTTVCCPKHKAPPPHPPPPLRSSSFETPSPRLDCDNNQLLLN